MRYFKHIEMLEIQIKLLEILNVNKNYKNKKSALLQSLVIIELVFLPSEVTF